MIWKLGAANGERLVTGDMAPDIVDCNAPFLLAAIPQDRFSDVEVGGLAQFRLSPSARCSSQWVSCSPCSRVILSQSAWPSFRSTACGGAYRGAIDDIDAARDFLLGKRLMR